MAETVQRRAALHNRYTVGTTGPQRAKGVIFAERRPLTIINLQGTAEDAAFRDAVQKQIGMELPGSTDTVASSGTHTIFWLGPDRWWLVLSSPEADSTLEDDLKTALNEQVAAVTDVSHGWTAVRIGGEAARDLLAKLCSLDLHPRGFKPGSCVQTELRGFYVVLHAVDESPRFDLFLPRSYVVSMWEWLVDAAAEFTLRIDSPLE